jgi:type II secretory pathway component GspD/PulD (secretin)
MKVNSDKTGRGMMRCVPVLAGLLLSLTLFAPGAGAQTQAAEQKPAEAKPDAEAYQTLYLTNVTQQNDAHDILTDLRNMLPKARIYYVTSPDAISMRATPEDIQLARKILSEIDRPRKVYRLTYTITETDSGKRIGTQHYAFTVAANEKANFKQGSRMPIATGSQNAEGSTQNAQVQYVDVGLNIRASLDSVTLHSTVEQSSIAEEKSSVGVQDPVIRQTSLEGMSPLAPGKTFVLGSIDIPGSTRHLEIEVVAELVQ